MPACCFVLFWKSHLQQNRKESYLNTESKPASRESSSKMQDVVSESLVHAARASAFAPSVPWKQSSLNPHGEKKCKNIKPSFCMSPSESKLFYYRLPTFFQNAFFVTAEATLTYYLSGIVQSWRTLPLWQPKKFNPNIGRKQINTTELISLEITESLFGALFRYRKNISLEA